MSPSPRTRLDPPTPRREGRRPPWRPALLVALIWSLSACTTPPSPPPGPEMATALTPEERLQEMKAASEAAPDNRELRMRFLNARARFVAELLREAQRQREVGQFDGAEAAFRRVLNVDPDNLPAKEGLQLLDQDRRDNALLDDAARLLASNKRSEAEAKIAQVLQNDPRNAAALQLRQQIENDDRRNTAIPPVLRKAFQKPVTLEFRAAPLRQVLEALSRHVGLNFVLDKDVPPETPISVFLRQVSVGDALDVIVGTNRLRRRVLNDTTLLIYPDIAEKVNDNQDLVVKNFFLANAEAKQVATMLRTLLKARSVFADDKLNLLIMRDTPEMIRLAERMIGIHDVSEPEVMLELEVLEIQRSKLLNLGIQYPDQLTLFPIPSIGTVLTLRDLTHLRQANVGAAISDTVINLQNILSNGNLLANPRLRTHNREKALIRIGDRVPVITTTATSTGFVSENVQYVDVGLKLEVEPTIFPNDEVSIRLALEVSSVTKQFVSKAGTTTYQIGGRNASTVLRLKDGETQILGGLINDQELQTANRIPGLGSLPLLGRLFSSQRDNRDKTELLLAVTPRLVRTLQPPTRIAGEFWSGTENLPRLNSLTLPRTVGGSSKPLPLPAMPPLPPATTPPALQPTPTPLPGPGAAATPGINAAPPAPASAMPSAPPPTPPASPGSDTAMPPTPEPPPMPPRGPTSEGAPPPPPTLPPAIYNAP